jgi:hypothetical protein
LRGNLATLDCHFLLATKDGVQYIRDPHRLGCFDEKRFLGLMRQAGLRSRFLNRGLMPDRGLYIGVKRGQVSPGPSGHVSTITL